jgi:uncharacterized protein with NAD-binding domain and iron-sulfur cluster
MGDAVIAPLYQVLLNRGVKFEFFHKVNRLELSDDRKRVERIHFNQQVLLKNGTYRPFITVKGLDCFPAEPLWEQIIGGDEMRSSELDLETKWDQRPPAGTRVLEFGNDKHFEHVVLALSLGAMKTFHKEDPGPCEELINASTPFANAVTKLGLVPALSLQLWLTAEGLENDLGFDYKGASRKDPPNLVSARPQHTIWADMSQVLEFEDWKGPERPQSVHYLCGVYEMDLHRMPSSEPGIEKRAADVARAKSIEWLKANAGLIWPKSRANPPSPAIDWQLLYDDTGRVGEARIDAQYLRSNVDPTEICVASHRNTSQHRLRSHESGFSNLALAGAWIWTGLNVESVESAVMSGMQAARAISGSPERIVGEHFFQRPPR